MQRALPFLRTNGRMIAFEIAINGVLPIVVYDLVHPALGDVKSLLASMVPPLLWSVAEFVRKRKVDIFSIFVIAGIVLSLLAFIGGGSAKFLQLRENLVNGLIALVFLGSAAIGRPLIYYLARATLMRRNAAELESFEALRDNVHFRRTMLIMTLVWGFGLLIEAGVAGVLVFTLSVHDYLIASPFVGNGTMGALGLWTFWYVRRQRRKGEARRAAEAAAAAPETSGS